MRTAIKDPYKILGVSKSATQDEIKIAYRKLAKKNHPDLNPGNKQAEAKFKDISHAYDLIGTPEERSKFDRGETTEQQQEAQARQQKQWEESLKKGRSGTSKSSFYNTQQEGGRYSHSFGQEFDNEDFFNEIFNRTSRQRSAAQKGSDSAYSLEISLADTITDTEKLITLPNGKSISVKIPAGINTGTKLRFKGLGEPGPDGFPPGDAFIEINVMPIKGFKKNGNDIETELDISFIEALIGAELSVPTLHGPVMLKIPAGVNTGSRLRIKGKGIQSSSGTGSQIVKLKIVMPKKLDQKLYEEIKSWKNKFDYNPRENSQYTHHYQRRERSEGHYNV